MAITSIAVRQPIPNLILSNTARAGVTGFLKTLAREVAGDGVTVNSIQPGFHETDRIRELHGGDASGLAASVPAEVLGRPEDFGAVGGVPVLGPGPFRHRDRRSWSTAARTRGSEVLRHVVLLDLGPGNATRGGRGASRPRCAALPDRIPEIRAYCGRPRTLGVAEGNADLAVVADFDDVDAWRVYRDDPEHQRVIAELIRPNLADRTAAQFDV